MTTMAAPITIAWVLRMGRPRMVQVPLVASIGGNDLVPAPNNPRIRYCSVNDAPIEVMSGISRGAPRRGRYATRSRMTAMEVEVAMVTIIKMSRESTGWSFHRPALLSPSATKKPTIIPLMKTSPWAKLMKRRTP